jgi:tetratricopeptide (TPR) repeat protein
MRLDRAYVFHQYRHCNACKPLQPDRLVNPSDGKMTAIDARLHVGYAGLHHAAMLPAPPASASAILAKLQAAVALHKQGQLLQAQRLYEEILTSQPRHFDAQHLLGVIAAARGDASRAAELIGKAIDIDPSNPVAHNNRGAALLELGRWEAALSAFDLAVVLKRDYADAHYNRGNALRELKRWPEALSSYDRALFLRPAHPQAHLNRGIVLAVLGQREASIASFEAAIALDGNLSEAYYNLANALCSQRKWHAALAGFDRAIALSPHSAAAHANRGLVLYELRRLDESLASSERAIAIKPDHLEALCNRGNVLLAKRQLAAALSSFDQALRINPNHAAGRVNRAHALLLAGDYEKGWADYAWRWKDQSSWVAQEDRGFSQPQWLGAEPITGKTILLHSEQGYGDTIQFCRYATLVANLGAKVILEVPAALVTLLSSLRGAVHVMARGERLPDFDMFCPLLNLPLALRTTVSTIPAQVPYLSESEDLRRVWSQKLGTRKRARIGLVWSSGFRPAQPELWSDNARRNIPLASFAAFKDLDADFYSLQKGEAAEAELDELNAQGWHGPKIQNLAGELADFADSAALIEQLDLVISVDTSVAHLAGALSKPVWVLIRFDACWRWLLDREDSPWYPSARLYRQRQPDDWGSVMSEVVHDLGEWLRRSKALKLS